MRYLRPILSLLRLAAAALVLVCAAPARAELAVALARFDDVVAKESRSLFAGRGDSMNSISRLRRLHQQVADERWWEASETVHQLKYEIGTPGMFAAATPLLDELRLLQHAAEEEYLRKMEAGVETATAACRAARTPLELDGAIAAVTPLVQRWPNDGREESQRIALAREKVRAALQYMRTWQEYLTLRELGKEAEAAGKMGELARNYEAYPVVARSEVLLRSLAVWPGPRELPPIDPEQKIREAFAEVQSIEQLDSVWNELKSWANQRPEHSQFRAAATQLDMLRTARAALAAGDFGAAWKSCAEQPPIGVPSDLLKPWRADLLRQILPHYLEADDLTQPQGQEDPADYLRRVAASAARVKKWRVAAAALASLGRLSFSSGYEPRWLATEMQSLSALIAAERQEQAGEFAEAYYAYNEALRTPGELVPVALITDRMRRLRQKHPEVLLRRRAGPRPPRPEETYE